MCSWFESWLANKNCDSINLSVLRFLPYACIHSECEWIVLGRELLSLSLLFHTLHTFFFKFTDSFNHNVTTYAFVYNCIYSCSRFLVGSGIRFKSYSKRKRASLSVRMMASSYIAESVRFFFLRLWLQYTVCILLRNRLHPVGIQSKRTLEDSLQLDRYGNSCKTFHLLRRYV